MTKYLLSLALAFALITGKGELIRPDQEHPFWASASECMQAASAIGNGATCKYVSSSKAI